MSAGASGLTDLRVSSAGSSLQETQVDQEAALIRAKVDQLLQIELGLERRRQKERCGNCGAQMEACVRDLKKEIELQVLDMGLKLAEIVLRHALPDRDMLVNLIRDTLGPISDLQGVRVRVSPAEAEGLKNPGGGGLPCPAVSEQVAVVADSTLSNGDLIIESRNGIFDGRLKERMSLLKDKLSERMKQPHADAAKTP